MSIFKRKADTFGKHEKTESSENVESDNSSSEPVLVTSIVNIVSSEIFQDILKENGIPFICRQRGAGGSIKILFGGGVVPDDIYVAEKNYEKACELYQVYLNTEAEIEETDMYEENTDEESTVGSENESSNN